MLINPTELEYVFEQNISMQWDYNLLSQNESITWKMVRNNLNKPWNWKYLSKNKAITIDIIEENEFLKWDWSSISQNPNITFDIICDNLHCKWDFTILRHILTIEEYKILICLEKEILLNNNYDDETY